jgi:AhpD family alkylhydroperoxidase
MAHVLPRPVSGSGLFIRLVYREARRRLGRVPIPIGIAAWARRVLFGMASFELATENPRALDPRLKDLVTVRAAMIVGCRFCLDIGSALARTRTLDDADLRALIEGETNPHFSERERAVLQYAVAMTETPMRVEREQVEALVAELGHEAFVELTAAVAWENYRARFNHACGAKEEGYSEGAFCLLLPPGEAVGAASGAEAAA